MNFLQFQLLAPLLFILGVLLNISFVLFFRIIIIFMLFFIFLYKFIDKFFIRLGVFFLLGLFKGCFDNFYNDPYSYSYTSFEAEIVDIRIQNDKRYFILKNCKYINDYDTKLMIKLDSRAIFPQIGKMEIPDDFNEDISKIKKIRAIGRFFIPIGSIMPDKYKKFTPTGKIKEFQVIEYKNRSVKNYFRLKFNSLLNEKSSQFCSAVFLADTFRIDQDTRALYDKAGVSHLLGPSTLNLAFLLWLLYYLFYYLLAKYFLKISSYIPLATASKICSLISIILYLFVIGIDYPLLRGFFSSFIALILLMFKRQAPLESLLFVAAIIIGMDTNSINDLGFQLSFGGILGIYAFDFVKFKNRFLTILFHTFSATTVLSMIIIYNFQVLSLQPYIANLIIIPIMSIIIPVILIFMCLPCFIANKLAFLINYLVQFLEIIVKYTAKTSMIIRFNPIKIEYVIAALFFYILFAMIKEKKRYFCLAISYSTFFLGLYKARYTNPFILINKFGLVLVLKDKIIAYPKSNFITNLWSEMYQMPCEDGKDTKYFRKIKNNKIIVLDKIGIINDDCENEQLNDDLENYVFTYADLNDSKKIEIKLTKNINLKRSL